MQANSFIFLPADQADIHNWVQKPFSYLIWNIHLVFSVFVFFPSLSLRFSLTHTYALKLSISLPWCELSESCSWQSLSPPPHTHPGAHSQWPLPTTALSLQLLLTFRNPFLIPYTCHNSLTMLISHLHQHIPAIFRPAVIYSQQTFENPVYSL